MYYCPRLNIALTRPFPLIGFQIITELRSPEDLPCLAIDNYLTDNNRLASHRRDGNKYLSMKNRPKQTVLHTKRNDARHLQTSVHRA